LNYGYIISQTVTNCHDLRKPIFDVIDHFVDLNKMIAMYKLTEKQVIDRFPDTGKTIDIGKGAKTYTVSAQFPTQ
jgi:hypothetical protein